MENAYPEKGTMEILRNSQPELSDPRFSELLMKRIGEERNRKIRSQLRINYSLIFLSIGLIIFLLVRSVILNPPIVNENPGNIYPPGLNGNGAGGFADYGYFVVPLIILLVFKKLIDSRTRYR